MKKILLITGLAAAFIFSPIIRQDVQAQITGVNDTMKSPSRLSLWFGKIKSNCEKAMEWVSNSKMGKLVGDGIKAAQDGMKYAQDQMTAAMEFYNDNRNAVLNSKEYKAAQLSKQIAFASMELKNIEGEKKEKLESLKQQVSVIEDKYAQKIAAAQKNLEKLESNVGKVWDDNTSSQALGDFSDGYADANLEMAQKSIENLKIQQEQELKSLNGSLKDIESSYKNKALKQSEKIAGLTNKLQAVYSGEEISIKPPTEALEKAKNEIFQKDNSQRSVASDNKMKEKRLANRRQAIYDVYEKALRTQVSLKKLKDEVNSTKKLAKVTPGESETSGIHTQVMTEEIELLYKYAEMVVNDLILQSTVAAAKLTPATVNKKYSKFKLCDYSEYGSKDNSLMGQIKQAKSTVGQLQEKAVSGINKVSSTYNSVQEKAQGFKDKVEGYQQDLSNATAAVGELKNTGDALKNSISNPGALEGMI